MKRKTGLSLQRHKEIGVELVNIRNHLIALNAELCGAYPVGKVTDAADRAHRAVDRLRANLAGAMYEEHRGHGALELAGVYFGRPAEENLSSKESETTQSSECGV